MSTIAAGTTITTSLVNTGDTTGQLVLQTNGTTTAVTIGTNQVVTLAQPLPAGSGGTGNAFFSVSGPASSTKTYTFPNANMSVGYLNIPQSGAAKTTSYTLTTSDIGQFIQVSTSGSIVIPDATFSAGDAVVIFNNTSGSITITCTITTAYIGGTDSDKATVSLATRGVCNILFISGTVCVITGNVS